EVIIISGRGSYAEAVKALRLHAFDFVSKPFDVNQVLQAVHRAAASAQGRREASSRRALHALATELADAVEELAQAIGGKLSDDERTRIERIRAIARGMRGVTAAG